MSDLMEHKISGVEKRMTSMELELQSIRDKNEETHRRIFDRLEPVERGGAVTAVQYTQIMGTLNELKDDIKVMKGKPDKVVDKIITALITLVIVTIGGFIIIKVLGGMG